MIGPAHGGSLGIGPSVSAAPCASEDRSMVSRRVLMSLFAIVVALAAAPVAAQAPKPAAKPAAAAVPSPGAGPIIVVETVKGTFEFETYPDEAPKTVEHILRLVNRNFYNGLRVHRLVPGFVVQFGDPQTRDMSKRDSWGRGSASQSGKPIGVAEISKKRTHVLGAVAVAHSGNPADGDSQIYVVTGDNTPNTRNLNGKYAVFGKVISGMDAVMKLQETDVIKKMYVKK
jgi:cyclophilin family peptidyl-prolyl cis-trans isomerase